MAREDLHFRLRIPEDLKSRVEMAAAKNHRSMTAEIIATLEEKYPADVLTAEELLALLKGMTGPMSLDEQHDRAEELNFILDYFGVDLEAHLQSGDIILAPTAKSKMTAKYPTGQRKLDLD